MPVQNPLTRIEQVATDLGRLADELGDYYGAQSTFLYLRSELIASLDAISSDSRACQAAGSTLTTSDTGKTVRFRP